MLNIFNSVKDISHTIDAIAKDYRENVESIEDRKNMDSIKKNINELIRFTLNNRYPFDPKVFLEFRDSFLNVFDFLNKTYSSESSEHLMNDLKANLAIADSRLISLEPWRASAFNYILTIENKVLKNHNKHRVFNRKTRKSYTYSELSELLNLQAYLLTNRSTSLDDFIDYFKNLEIVYIMFADETEAIKDAFESVEVYAILQ